jgi:hypothetical protein
MFSFFNKKTRKNLHKSISNRLNKITHFNKLNNIKSPTKGVQYTVEKVKVISKYPHLKGDIFKKYVNGKLVEQKFVTNNKIKEKLNKKVTSIKHQYGLTGGKNRNKNRSKKNKKLSQNNNNNLPQNNNNNLPQNNNNNQAQNNTNAQIQVQDNTTFGQNIKNGLGFGFGFELGGEVAQELVEGVFNE